MAPTLWDIIERSRHGEKVEEKVFDLSIFRRLQPLIKEYGLKYDPQNPVCTDDTLIDRVFEAAVRFYVEQGTYCVSTNRVIKFSEQELRDALTAAPSSMTLGEGKDRVVMAHRGVEDRDAEPIVCAGIQTAPYSDEETQSIVYELCARDRCVDGIWGGLITRVDGKYDVVAGTPGEILQYQQDIGRLRGAAARAGRPGMFIINNAPSSIATIAMADRETGLRPTDPFETTGISELKVAYDDLNRTAFGTNYGSPLHGAINSVIGGFSGGPEGAAITAVAGVFQLLMVNLAASMRPGVVSFSAKSRVTRDQLWVSGLALQALSRNTHLVLDGGMGDHPSAGPGTLQYFREAAAGFIVSTVCGGHSTGGTRKFVVSNVVNYGSPLESRWMGEICKSSVGVSREEANGIAKALLEKYEGSIKTAPEGHTLWHLYDRDRLEPNDRYLAIYQEAREELASLGIKWRIWD